MSTKNIVEARWFHIAVQALVVLADSQGAQHACSSARIAQDLETHAAFLRRVLAQLVRAAIVEAQEGRAGGYRLARPCSEITLDEVFAAVKPADPVEHVFGGQCANTHVEAMLEEIRAEAEQCVLNVLAGYTLAALLPKRATDPERSGGIKITSSRTDQ